MAELANRLGYGDRYPQTEEEVITQALEGSGYSAEDVRAAGGWVKLPTPMMEYRKWEKGGLRTDGAPGFETPTGKFEIHSTILADYGYEPLPKYVEPREGPKNSPELLEDFPLVFNSGARPHTDFRSQHHGIAGLAKDHPEPAVEINVEDAGARGIQGGDLVEVRSPRGAVPFRAVVTDEIVRGSVECNMGGGAAVGPRAWQEWNVNLLTDLTNYDEISGFPVYKSLLCDVVKIGDGSANSKTRAKQTASSDREAMPQPAARAAPKRRIYLDNSATTQVAPAVRDAMQPYLSEQLGNPSSIHGVGRTAKEAVETARRQIAKLINCRPRRLILTGGGSESDNLAIKGVAFAARDRGNHLITSTIEHPAVLQTCRFLEQTGYRVTYLPVDEYGLVNPVDLTESIDDETILVSIMMANNEVGTIQPIKDLCAITHERGVLFHTDAVQAVGKMPVDVEDLAVDLLTLSGHKFHGPKGVGGLYAKKDVPLEALVHGGAQEAGVRAGTENVPAIVGLGKAAELARLNMDRWKDVSILRDRLEAGVRELVPSARLNGHPERRAPNILNLTLPKLRGESLVVALDQHGVSLSSGSACKSGSPDPTHVLLAMGHSDDEAHCSIRFSLAHDTNQDDIDDTIDALGRVLRELETTVRFLPCK
jgi:cysteine desulfurase NifS